MQATFPVCHACHGSHIAILDVKRDERGGYRYYCERDWLTVHRNRVARVPSPIVGRDQQPYEVAFWSAARWLNADDPITVCVSATSRDAAIALAAKLTGFHATACYYACMLTEVNN